MANILENAVQIKLVDIHTGQVKIFSSDKDGRIKISPGLYRPQPKTQELPATQTP